MAFVSNIKVLRYYQNEFSEEDDLVAVEEPLEIRLGFGKGKDRVQERLIVTMRTPGHDFELATGVLYSENIINSFKEINSIHYCETVKPEEKDNVIRVELNEDIVVDWSKLQRNFYANAACGVCGKSSIEAALQTCKRIESSNVVKASIIKLLPSRLKSDQFIFSHTGGIHAVGIFDKKGELLELREDVGRHNALDKIIGHFIAEKIDFSDKVLLLSGRISYELVQKSARAGISIICAVGAPSSLAVQLAKSTGITLVGFLKADYFNIYTGSAVIDD